MITLYRRLKDKDRGIAMAWMAFMLVLLLGASGFAVDLGWLYLSSSRVQRTADSAALAGVVNLPGFAALADLEARDAARANGYDVCDPGFSGCQDSLTATPLAANELQVEISTSVPSIFLSVMGFDNFEITREATAEYVKPVPLGSPSRCFGQDPTGTFCPANPYDFWAAVSGRYSRKQDGDPYSTFCLNASSGTSCSSSNSDYARGGTYDGYYYAIEVFETGVPLEVWVYDARFDERNNYPDVETADARFTPGGAGPGVTTRYEVQTVDATPQDVTDNTPATCASGPGTVTLSPDLYPSSSPQKNTWYHLCTISNPTLGQYQLHVESTVQGSGTNNYSVAARQSGASTQPRVYGINDMSIFSNKLDIAAWSQLYLVEVTPEHAGSKLELQFFDAGDASGFSEMRVRDPLGNIPTCDYEVWNHNQTTLITSGSGSCSWVTSNPPNTQIYNNEWIIAIIDLPDDPAMMCGADCFWYMEMDLSQPNERTTWRARVIGNPVKLVP